MEVREIFADGWQFFRDGMKPNDYILRDLCGKEENCFLPQRSERTNQRYTKVLIHFLIENGRFYN